MTDPLEIAAKAHWESHPDDVPPWEMLDQKSRDDDMRRMRSCLLALAEAELPDSLVYASWNIKNERPESEIMRAAEWEEIDGFRKMLRAIAGGRG